MGGNEIGPTQKSPRLRTVLAIAALLTGCSDDAGCDNAPATDEDTLTTGVRYETESTLNTSFNSDHPDEDESVTEK